MSEEKTLRDEIAMNAPEIAVIGVKKNREDLVGEIEPMSDSHIELQLRFNCLVEARLRYIYADAMLEARNK